MQNSEGISGISFFLCLVFFLFALERVCFCEDIGSLSRELAIISTLNQAMDVLDKNEAVEDAFVQAEELFSEELNKQRPASGEHGKGKKEDFFSRNVRTSVSHSLEYNDNIYNLKDKRSEFINRIDLGSRVDLSGKRHHLFLDAMIDYETLLQKSQDSLFAVNLGVLADKEIYLHGVSLAERFKIDYISEASEFNANENAFVRRQENNFSLSLRREFNRLGYGLKYEWFTNSFEARYKSRDFVANTFSLDESFRIAPKTRIFLEYQFGLVRHPSNKNLDSSLNAFNIGVRDQLTGKLSGEMKWGYQTQNYKGATDFKDVALHGALHYAVAELTALDIGWDRATHESTSLDQDYFVNNSFTLSGGHIFSFNTNLFLNFNNEFLFADYPKLAGTGREDTTYTLGVNLGYNFRKWLRFVLGYAYTSRKSNVVYDYNSNVFSLSTQAQF